MQQKQRTDSAIEELWILPKLTVAIEQGNEREVRVGIREYVVRLSEFIQLALRPLAQTTCSLQQIDQIQIIQRRIAAITDDFLAQLVQLLARQAIGSQKLRDAIERRQVLGTQLTCSVEVHSARMLSNYPTAGAHERKLANSETSGNHGSLQ